jgi:hypothetical protein
VDEASLHPVLHLLVVPLLCFRLCRIAFLWRKRCYLMYPSLFCVAEVGMLFSDEENLCPIYDL